MRLIAHRGASAYAPENTMAAFELALKMGAEEVEFDVHQTKDGRLVVIHDADLKRVSKSPKRVRDLTLKELQSFDVGEWFHARFSGERVPALDEVLALLKGKAVPHVELKCPVKTNPGVAENLLETLKRRDPKGKSVVSSFDHPSLAALRKLDAKLRLGVLTGMPIGARVLKTAADLKATSLDVSRRGLNAKAVQAAHDKGLKVLAYTVNDAAELDKLEKAGVDGVFTNHPDIRSSMPVVVGGTN